MGEALLLNLQTACFEILELFGGQTDRQTKRLVEAPSRSLKIDINFKHVNLEQSSLDQALYFIKDQSNELIGILLIHVDDCIFGGIDTFHKTVIRPITEKYEISSEDIGEFTFTGWNLRQTESGISISQNDYIETVDFDKFCGLRNPQGTSTDKIEQ